MRRIKIPPPEATCCVCMARKQCVTTRETETGIRTYDNFVYSEEHRGWLCKSCHRRTEWPKKKREWETEQLEMFGRPPPTFEEFWQEYPKRNGRRVGKQAAMAGWYRLREEDRPLAVKAAQSYARSEVVRRGYARDANRFLAAEFWRDWLVGPGDDSDERGALVEKLKSLVGRRYGSSTIVTPGLESMHGAVVKWEEMSTEKLRQIEKETTR